MTEDDFGWGDPPEVAQPQDGLASQPRARLVQPGGRHRRPVPAWLLILDRLAARQAYLAARQAYLIVPACLAAGILVSAGLAAAEIADYPNGVGYLAIPGIITGAVAGLAAVGVNEEKPRGWVYGINVVAMWLALISVTTLVLFFTGQHGWYMKGG